MLITYMKITCIFTIDCQVARRGALPRSPVTVADVSLLSLQVFHVLVDAHSGGHRFTCRTIQALIPVPAGQGPAGSPCHHREPQHGGLGPGRRRHGGLGPGRRRRGGLGPGRGPQGEGPVKAEGRTPYRAVSYLPKTPSSHNHGYRQVVCLRCPLGGGG